jgi:zinc D-Ala-D-Ala carboxypeptidase
MITIEQAKAYKLSKNFTLWEFLRSNTAIQNGWVDEQLAIPEVYILNLKRLCDHVLQPLRNRFGPVTILAGYRSPKVNVAVKGAKNSEHMYGRAADIRVADMPLAFEFLKTLKFRQLIDEYNLQWIHVSYDEHDNKKQILKIG